MNIDSINEVAFKEGWGLFFDATSVDMEINLEKVDDLNIFKTDADAISFVKDLANRGSFIHIKAIEICDRQYK